MRTYLITRALCTLLIVSITLPALAGTEPTPPFKGKSIFKNTTELFGKKNNNSVELLIGNETAEATKMAKVCVCEIVSLEDNNSSFSDVAVFAERAASSEIGKDYKVAERKIAKEKRNLKTQFFNSVVVEEKIAVAADCETLYLALKKRNAKLKVYEVLNADITAK